MIAVASSLYHAHIYFTPERAEVAASLQARAQRTFGDRAEVSALVPKPVGPHQAPMFEIDFGHAERDEIIGWLDRHHGELPVLLHPVTEDELADHTLHLVWLGDEVPLDLTKL